MGARGASLWPSPTRLARPDLVAQATDIAHQRRRVGRRLRAGRPAAPLGHGVRDLLEPMAGGLQGFWSIAAGNQGGKDQARGRQDRGPVIAVLRAAFIAEPGFEQVGIGLEHGVGDMAALLLERGVERGSAMRRRRIGIGPRQMRQRVQQAGKRRPLRQMAVESRLDPKQQRGESRTAGKQHRRQPDRCRGIAGARDDREHHHLHGGLREHRTIAADQAGKDADQDQHDQGQQPVPRDQRSQHEAGHGDGDDDEEIAEANRIGTGLDLDRIQQGAERHHDRGFRLPDHQPDHHRHGHRKRQADRLAPRPGRLRIEPRQVHEPFGRLIMHPLYHYRTGHRRSHNHRLQRFRKPIL